MARRIQIDLQKGADLAQGASLGGTVVNNVGAVIGADVPVARNVVFRRVSAGTVQEAGGSFEGLGNSPTTGVVR